MSQKEVEYAVSAELDEIDLERESALNGVDFDLVESQARLGRKMEPRFDADACDPTVEEAALTCLLQLIG